MITYELEVSDPDSVYSQNASDGAEMTFLNRKSLALPFSEIAIATRYLRASGSAINKAARRSFTSLDFTVRRARWKVFKQLCAFRYDSPPHPRSTNLFPRLTMHPVPMISHPCAVCGRSTSMWCSRCQRSWYCSPEHLREVSN